jgi:molybdate/tungstate transport system substrate-binding protein
MIVLLLSDSLKKSRRIYLILYVIIGISSLYLIEESTFVLGTSSSTENKVNVMYAGSLVKIFEDVIGPAFQNETDYQYVGEGKGSVQIANMIKNGFRTPDVFVSSGTVPMDMLLNSSPPFVNWLANFGSAEIVIAYTSHGQFFSKLEKARNGEIPWYQVVSSDGFKLGRTDPELDPKGYYGIITAELANLYYNDSSIKDRVFGDDRNAKQIYPEETLKTVLEAGQLDAIIAYKHEAISKKLSYISLPQEINLADPAYSDFYESVNYTLQSSNKTIYGEPIEFSITIPKTVKNIDGATAFVNFILSNNGSKLLKSQGLNPINLTFEGNITSIPKDIENAIV